VKRDGRVVSKSPKTIGRETLSAPLHQDAQRKRQGHGQDIHLYIPPIPDNAYDESVYDLIPIAIVPPPKPPRHVSRYAEMARAEDKAGIKPMASMGPLRVITCGPERFLKKGDGQKLKPEGKVILVAISYKFFKVLIRN
jgi:hypothetical protein